MSLGSAPRTAPQGRPVFPALLLAGLILPAVLASAQPALLPSAAAEVARQLAASVPRLNGTVTAVEGHRVVLDLGARDGVREGLSLAAHRGTKPIGRVTVREVRERFSIAEVVERAEGVAALAREDRVRFGADRLVVALAELESGDVTGVTNPTRDVALALIRVGFEVIEQPHLKVALWSKRPLALTDPESLAVLAERVGAHLLVLPRVVKRPEGTGLEAMALALPTGVTMAQVSVPLSTAALATRPAAPSPPAGTTGPPPLARSAPGVEVPQLARPSGPFMQPTTPSGLPVTSGLIPGPSFPETMRALAVGDVDGDGRREIVIADDRNLHGYAFDGAGFQLLWKRPGKRAERILALDAADVNGNGVDELFVTAFDGERLNSFVLEMQRGAVVTLWDEANVFFRVLPAGGGGKLELLGQKFGTLRPFDSPIHRYQWDGRTYREGPPLAVPPGLSVYGLAVGDLEGRGEPLVLALDVQNDRLKVFDMRGRLVHRSADRLGGSERFINFRVGRGEAADAVVTLPILSRVYLVGGPGPGTQIIVWQNIPATTWAVGPTGRFYNRVRLFGFRWAGSTLERVWETQELNGYLADYALAAPHRGAEPHLFLLLVHSGSELRPSARSRLMAYRWGP